MAVVAARGAPATGTMGTSVGTKASNREDQRASMSTSDNGSTPAKCLIISNLEKHLTAMVDRARRTFYGFSLRVKQAL